MVSYTGVGSRKAPAHAIGLMYRFGMTAARLGYVLRSGHAKGSDMAFEDGCDVESGPKEIYLPKPGFNGSTSKLRLPDEIMVKAEELASSIHGNWSACDDFARRAHTRNVFQVLGEHMNSPSQFLVCYTEDGRVIGGTATAIKIAKKYGVPVYNIGRPKVFELISMWVEDPAVWLGNLPITS